MQSLQCNTKKKQKRTRNEERKINITAELSNEHFHFLTTFEHFQLKIITVFSDLIQLANQFTATINFNLRDSEVGFC